MDFFSHQDRARRNTTLLIILFVFAVISVVLLIDFALLLMLPNLLIGEMPLSTEPLSFGAKLWLIVTNPSLTLLKISGVIAGIIFIASFLKLGILRMQGGPGIASMLGGRPVSTDPANIEELRLRNVVEEMAIASGTPMPQLFVMSAESGVNAFAAGLHHDDAVIAVTSGCLQKLNRDQLQAVIAHEFSHIFHGDMRLNINLMGWLHGILFVSYIGEFMMEMRSSDRKNRGQMMLLGLAIRIIGYGGYIFGQAIKAAVSREREYLADASAVQFTRNPDAMAGALRSVAVESGQIEAPQANQVSHMFFANAMRGWLTGLFATHPPIDERIRRINPQYSAGIKGNIGTHSSTGISALAGTVSNSALESSSAVLSSVPPGILQSTREMFGAKALVYALIFRFSSQATEELLALSRAQHDRALANEIETQVSVLNAHSTSFGIAILELCIPTLRELSTNQLKTLAKDLRQFVFADKKLDLMEMLIFKVLEHRLISAKKVKRKYRISAHQALHILLSELAQTGNKDPHIQRRSYLSGWKSAGVGSPPAINSGQNMKDLAAALDKLASASPKRKRLSMEACYACLMHDGHGSESEQILFRAFCLVLSVPIPIA